MQANIQLALKTREVFKLFERRIDGNRMFIDAILHKFNIVVRQCKKQVPEALAAYNQIEKAMLALTMEFADEVNRFETILANQKYFIDKKISLVVQFYPTIILSTSLSIKLIEFIEIYDQLVAILKLIHLAGCFTSDNDCYSNIKRIQKLTNQMLSRVILMPTD